jgi:methylated-DNA-[protein]-cysteine S-methyltransferase
MNTMTFDQRAIDERLRDAAVVDPHLWRRLSAAIADQAESEELIDVAFERHDSPLGPIIVAATRQGLVRIGLPAEGEERRTQLDVTLDWQLTGGFRRQVLAATAEIPYGQTASYTDVATRAGSPRAVRAAGTALATNPPAIVVPCHRVLKRSGDLGAYRGGPDAKAALISLEARGHELRLDDL